MPKGFMSSSIIHNCIYLSQNPQTYLKSFKYSIYPGWHVVAYFYFISISPWHVCSHNKSISFVTPEQILRNTPQLPEQPSLSRSLDPLSLPQSRTRAGSKIKLQTAKIISNNIRFCQTTRRRRRRKSNKSESWQKVEEF